MKSKTREQRTGLDVLTAIWNMEVEQVFHQACCRRSGKCYSQDSTCIGAQL